MTKPKYDVAEVCGYKKCKKFHMKKGEKLERKRILKLIDFWCRGMLWEHQGAIKELKKEIEK